VWSYNSINTRKRTTLDVETHSCGVAQKSSPHHRMSKRRGQLGHVMSMCVSHVYVCGWSFTHLVTCCVKLACRFQVFLRCLSGRFNTNLLFICRYIILQSILALGYTCCVWRVINDDWSFALFLCDNINCIFCIMKGSQCVLTVVHVFTKYLLYVRSLASSGIVPQCTGHASFLTLIFHTR